MHEEPSGEEIAELEREFWRAYRELRTTRAGYQRQRLARQASRAHMHYRAHRQARRDAPAVPDDTWILPPD